MIVYFTSKTGNTKRFVDKLDCPSTPIIPSLRMIRPFILVVSTYARNDGSGAVAPQVINFLNNNRHLMLGVISGGNKNFGKHFAYAGDVISQKCNTPLLHKFELFGSEEDVYITTQKIKKMHDSLYLQN